MNVSNHADRVHWTQLGGDGAALFELVAPAVFDDRTADSALTILNWLVQWELQLPVQSAEPIPQPDYDGSECGFAGWTSPHAATQTAPLPLSSLLPTTHNYPVPEAIGPWWSQLLPTGPSAPGSVPALAGVRITLGYWKTGGSDWQRTGPRATSGCIEVVDDAVVAIARVHNTEKVDPDTLRRVELSTAASTPGFLRRLAESPWDLMGVVGLRVPLHAISRVRCWQRVDTKAGLLNRRSKALIAERGYGDVNGAGICIEFSDGWRPLALQMRLEEFPGEAGSKALTAFTSALANAAATRRLRDDSVLGDDRAALEVAAGASPLIRVKTPVPGTKLGEQGTLVLGAELPRSTPLSVQLMG